MAEAQAERAAAFEEKAAAQEREAQQARVVVRRTRAGLSVAVVLAVAAVWFGVDANNQKDRAVAAATDAAKQTARAQAYVAQIYNDKGRYFEAAQAGLTNPLTLDTASQIRAVLSCDAVTTHRRADRQAAATC